MQTRFQLHTIPQAAAALLNAFPQARVFAVNGPMGAGKTTFITAVCGYLQVKDHPASPTFSLINQYETETGATVYHIDLYRLRDEEEARAAGIEDALYSGHYCFVEWPSIAPGIFPPGTVAVTIRIISATERELTATQPA